MQYPKLPKSYRRKLLAAGYVPHTVHPLHAVPYVNWVNPKFNNNPAAVIVLTINGQPPR